MMERHEALILAILRFTRAQPINGGHRIPAMSGYEQDVVDYHVHLCGQAGYLEALDVTSIGDDAPQYIVRRITWDGHNVLGAFGNGTI